MPKKPSSRKPAAGKPAARQPAARKSAAGNADRPARKPAVKRPATPRESRAERAARAARLLAALRAARSEASTALHHRSAYELLVATILSAQCTDVRVNQLTPALFAHYPDAHALAAADPAELEDEIRSTGFFRNKTRSLLGMAQQVCDDFGGAIPATMDELLRLPGVARKTANCVLGTWYRQNAGIVVDTHVGRLALRLGLAPSARNDKDAERIESDLMELFPQPTWTWLAHALILHGREVCTARSPACERCPLAADCPSAATDAPPARRRQPASDGL